MQKSKMKNCRFLMLLVLFLVGFCLEISADPLDNWSWRNPLPQGNWLNGVTYGNNTFVAVGGGGSILTSHDGISWVSRPSGTSSWLIWE